MAFHAELFTVWPPLASQSSLPTGMWFCGACPHHTQMTPHAYFCCPFCEHLFHVKEFSRSVCCAQEGPQSPCLMFAALSPPPPSFCSHTFSLFPDGRASLCLGPYPGCSVDLRSASPCFLLTELLPILLVSVVRSTSLKNLLAL